MVNIKQMVWEPMKNLIIFLFYAHEESSCTFPQEKQKVYIFIQVSKQRKWKNIKKQGCIGEFRILQSIYNGASL